MVAARPALLSMGRTSVSAETYGGDRDRVGGRRFHRRHGNAGHNLLSDDTGTEPSWGDRLQGYGPGSKKATGKMGRLPARLRFDLLPFGELITARWQNGRTSSTRPA
jgi:hypothetical protein